MVLKVRKSAPALSAMMLPEDIDRHGVVLIGCLLKYAIVAALQEASQRSEQEVGLTTITGLEFQELPRVGELVHFYTRAELGSRGLIVVTIDCIRRDRKIGTVVAMFTCSKKVSLAKMLQSVA